MHKKKSASSTSRQANPSKENLKKSLRPHETQQHPNHQTQTTTKNLLSATASSVSMNMSKSDVPKSRASHVTSLPSSNLGDVSEVKLSARTRKTEQESYMRHHPILDLRFNTVDFGKASNGLPLQLQDLNRGGLLNENSSTTLALTASKNEGINQQRTPLLTAISGLNQVREASQLASPNPHQTTSRFASLSPSFRAQKTHSITFSPHEHSQGVPQQSISSHYEQVLQAFELHHKDRLIALREGIYRIMHDCESDEILKAMREDQTTQSYTYQRMREVIDNALVTELEQQNSNLRNENVVLREQVRKEREGQRAKGKSEEQASVRIKGLKQKKDRYKQMASNFNAESKKAVERLKEVERELGQQRTDFEVKLAQKEGEIMRLERFLSDQKASLNDKSFHHQKVASNLTNELLALNDKIAQLTQENKECSEKYAQAEISIRDTYYKEKEKLQDKISKLKTQLKSQQEKLEEVETKCREQERKNIVLGKECEGLTHKIEELVKQSHEKVDNLKTIEAKQQTCEKETTSKLTRLKLKHKEALQDLTAQFESQLRDKLTDSQTQHSLKLSELDTQIRTLQAQNEDLKRFIQKEQETHKSELLLLKKQHEARLRDQQESQLKESGLRILEAEEAVRDCESRRDKEMRRCRKEMERAMEELTREHQERVEQCVREWSERVDSVKCELQGVIEGMRKEENALRIKVAEMNVSVRQEGQEVKRLMKELERVNEAYKNHQLQTQQEVQKLQCEVQKRSEEGEQKLKETLDVSLKHQTVEQLAQQLSQELSKSRDDYENERSRRQRVEQALKDLQNDFTRVVQDLEFTQSVVKDREAAVGQMRAVHRESLRRIETVAQIQLQKVRQDCALIKSQCINELTLSSKQSQSLFALCAAKLKESTLRQNYDQEKFQLVLESKFKSLISTREQEWEKAWEKRDQLLHQKEESLRLIEGEYLKVKELLGERESEVQTYQTQVANMLRDHESLTESLRDRLGDSEQRYEELIRQYNMHEERINREAGMLVGDVREQVTQQYQGEVERLKEQLGEAKEKGKHKVAELQGQIQEIIKKSTEDIDKIRNGYEQANKELDMLLDSKKQLAQELQSEVSILNILISQEKQARERTERDLSAALQHSDQLTQTIHTLQIELNQANQKYESFARDFERAEGQISEMQKRVKRLKQRKEEAERKAEKVKKEARKLSVQIGEQREREQQEVKILSDMLSMTMSPTSVGRKQQAVCSPQRPPLFSKPSNAGYIQRSQRPQSFSSCGQQQNYGSILSEINNLVQNQQPSSSPNKYYINTTSTAQKVCDLTTPSITQVTGPSFAQQFMTQNAPAPQFTRGNNFDENGQNTWKNMTQPMPRGQFGTPQQQRKF
ncbi:hypothetical protein FGO68_gene12493 [Halteria grandinella]|uniref:Uncharacterized protein n=1 Tax=Halteria grandinella TaxID=5974 RepID=A0A8J8P2P8_HALGN|nr:hypothetical protein FGO68_gene12493 [Halteria grandinella]